MMYPIARSWKPEVLVEGKWAANALSFRSEAEALAYARDLMSRWLLVEAVRAVPSASSPDYRWAADTGLVALPATLASFHRGDDR